MKIIESDYELYYGFAHVIVQENGNEYTIQACLMRRKDDKGFKKQIDLSDSGMNWGVCGDVNSKAFEELGEKRAIKIFKTAMRKIGIKLL